MSEFIATAKIKVKAYDAGQAASILRSAIQTGVREGLVLGGEVTGTPEECVCLTASELDARVKAAVEAARTAPVTT